MDGGLAGKILYIDLSNKTYHTEETLKYKEYIGGRGINQWLLFNMMEKNIEPLDPKSVIIIGSGLFVGTLVPSSNRTSVDFKNVLTGGVGSANVGGKFGPEMKYAGYDNIVIYGKAKEPTYLYINNDNIYFRDATQLWGKDTWETENIIKSLENEKGIKTFTIGVAGENLVKYACIIGDKGRAAGYGGGGAVFGSKNLKAIAIRGTNQIKIADPNGFMDTLRKFYIKLDNSNSVKNLQKGGTLLPYLALGQDRPHGVRNMNDEFWPTEIINSINRIKFDEDYLVRRAACFACPAACSSIYQINGEKVEGVQANVWRAFASNLDIRDHTTVLKANALANLYGIDSDQISAVIGWAIDCYENGIIDKTDTDGLELTWGNCDAVIALINNIGYRKGFGDLLADGIYEAAKVIGKGSERYGVLVKRTGLMEAAMRSHKAWALGIVTSTKGGGHLRGAPAQEMQNISPDISSRIFNIDSINDPTSYDNKAKLVVWNESYKGIVDMIGICLSLTMWSDINLFTLDDICQFYQSVTGKNIEPNKLLYIGEKIQNLERAFNLLHAGFGRKHDLPPDKLVNIGVSKGRFKGERLDMDMWNQMLDEYYILHGWDIETGWPTKECLERLELKIVIDKLKKNNISIS